MINGEIVYGKWISYCYKTYADSTSFLIVGDVLATPSGNPVQSNTSNFRQDTEGNVEASTYSWHKTDAYGNLVTDELDASDLWNVVSGLVSSMGQVPLLISTVFQFLPSWIIGMIAAGIALLVILRVVGR